MASSTSTAPPVQQLEVGGPGHVQPGAPAHGPVETPDRQGVQGALLSTAHLDAFHDLVALLPQAVHVHDLFRRVLEVAVQHHTASPTGLGQAGKNGSLLAEVAGEAHPPDLGQGAALLLDARPGPVPGAVVHKDQLMGDLGLLQQGGDDISCPGSHLLLVEGGEDHGEQSGVSGSRIGHGTVHLLFS